MTKETYDLVTPNKIISYLNSNNWSVLKDNLKLPYLIYNFNENHYIQVKVPRFIDINSYSYTSLIDETLEKISMNHGISLDRLVNDIINVNNKIIHIRYYNENMKNYNIPAKEITDLLENSKKMFLSSYADANLSYEDRIEYRRGNYTKEIKELADKIEFGQTQEGSYIIPMLIPFTDKTNIIEDIFANSNLDFDEITNTETKMDPTEIAIEKMITTIDEIKTFIDNQSSLEELLNKKSSKFTSIDYMNSLSNIGNLSTHSNVEFYSTINNKKSVKVKSSITNKYYDRINKFVETYKNKNETFNKFTGKLRRIDVEPNIFERTLISTKLEGQAVDNPESKIQKIDCEFSYDKHDIVFEAMEKGLTVIVEGDREANKLTNCSLVVIR